LIKDTKIGKRGYFLILNFISPLLIGETFSIEDQRATEYSVERVDVQRGGRKSNTPIQIITLGNKEGRCSPDMGPEMV
jgi:hypothetical protein